MEDDLKASELLGTLSEFREQYGALVRDVTSAVDKLYRIKEIEEKSVAYILKKTILDNPRTFIVSFFALILIISLIFVTGFSINYAMNDAGVSFSCNSK